MERTKVIVEDILLEAKKKAQEIVERARKEADVILQSAEVSGREEAEAKIRETKQRAEQLRRERLMREKLETRKKVLEKRENILNSILEEAKKELMEFSRSKQYQKWIEKEIEAVAEELGGEFVVDVREEDRGLLERLLPKLRGRGMSVQLGSTIRCLGGFVARTKDGREMIDCTFDARISRAWDDLRIKVAQILFGT